ncbi:MAG: hypothetical protein ACK5SP_02240 [bacterium]|jgi:hypothetical protein
MNDKINVRPTLQLNLTARDWDLYSTMSGVDEVATELNRLVEHAINTSPNRERASMQISTALLKFDEFGAADTEPRQVALQILKRCYP